MKIFSRSQISGKESTMELDITEEQLDRVICRRDSGELIQNIVPHLSPAEREFLISGITP